MIVQSVAEKINLLTTTSMYIMLDDIPCVFTHIIIIMYDMAFCTLHICITANVDPTRRYLYLQVLGGKAFLEHLQEGQPLPGQVTPNFSLHINFRGQRFRSRPTPCACDPDIQEGFLLELHKDTSGTL